MIFVMSYLIFYTVQNFTNYAEVWNATWLALRRLFLKLKGKKEKQYLLTKVLSKCPKYLIKYAKIASKKKSLPNMVVFSFFSFFISEK